MTVSIVRSDGNALVVSPDSEPDFAGDLSAISLDLSKRANGLAGTNAERRALPPSEVWLGLEFYETDTDQSYRYTVNGWRRVSGRTDWAWSAFRSTASGSDDVGAGQFTQISALDIPDAPAGDYSVTVNGSWFTAVDVAEPVIGYSRVMVNTNQVGPDQAMPLSQYGASLSRVVPLSGWAGGTLKARLLVNPLSVNGRFFNAGVGLVVQYLGPNS